MTRYLALCAALVVLGAAGPGHAQQTPPAAQPQPSPAPTQEQVEQPAPDVENLKEEDLNRTRAVQQQESQQQQEQQDFVPQPQLSEERSEANELLVTWQERLADKPEVVEQSEPVQNAWADLREAHSAVVLADEASMPVAQQIFEESAEHMEKVWTEATD